MVSATLGLCDLGQVIYHSAPPTLHLLKRVISSNTYYTWVLWGVMKTSHIQCSEQCMVASDFRNVSLRRAASHTTWRSLSADSDYKPWVSCGLLTCVESDQVVWCLIMGTIVEKKSLFLSCLSLWSLGLWHPHTQENMRFWAKRNFFFALV